jgi:hyperosmotically inducible periplasmic protein
MFRALFRLVIVVIVLVVAAAFFFGYRWGDFTGGTSEPVIGTSGSSERGAERAREAGARIGEQVAKGAERANAMLDEGRLTAKVKSKIALDDTLDGTSVSVDTAGDVVTLTGQVSTQAQHQRVLQLASETEGVSRVIDHVSVR